ncbi:MAG: hypothetical protein JXA67_09100, partial [Micromonosporaceae bacterium]|nr:hypothetical protein [Micromonosporaceae bacterium]
IDADLLLPVLDGLDEMDAPEAVPERAIAAIDQLNAQLDGHIGSPMIITCRTDGYRRMRETAGLVVRPAAEITVQPLASDEICDYLDRDYDRLGEWERVTQWDPVLDQLDDPTDRRLLAILRTPWHLTLAVNYHRDGGDLLALLPTTEERYPRPGAHFDTEEYGHNPRHSDDLSDPYSSRVMALLLAAFIPARSRAFADDLYQPDQVMRWCGTIATHLDDRVDIVPDRWWTIAGEERIRHWHKIVVATLAAALGLVTLGLFTLVSTVGSAGRTGNAAGVIIHAASLTTPFKTATIAVMCASLATQLLVLAGFPGLAAWRADQSHVRSASANPRQLLTWAGQRRMAGSLAFALGIWLIPSITCEAMLRTTGPATGLPAGMLAYGLAIGVTCGIVHGLRPVIEVATDPRTPLSNDATALVTIGLGMGLGFGLGAGQAYGPSLGLASGLAGGLACGLAGALAFGLAGHAWLRCTIAVIYTAYQQRLPLRCCHFLHWAYQAGILRVCGRGYQFRTAGLRDWLQQQQAGPYPLVPHRIPVTSAVE